jgi:hypothetical protein
MVVPYHACTPSLLPRSARMLSKALACRGAERSCHETVGAAFRVVGSFDLLN